MKFKDLFRSGLRTWTNQPIVRVMKLTILLMTTFLMQVSATGFAQRVTLNQKNASLKRLFTEIRKQTGYNVFYEQDKVNDALQFNASFSDQPLEDVLKSVLTPRSLTYEIVNNTVVVKRREQGILDRVAGFFARITVEGKVVDSETNQPIPGVTVTLTGTKRSVSTNAEGLFRFADVEDNASLSFSSIGYAAKSMSISETMYVRLSPVVETLEGVVISTGYQTLKKENVTGSYSVITAEDIAKAPDVNLLDRLAGQIPGVQFDPRTNKIQIRSVSSFSSNYPPLIVIDGFPAISQNLTTVTSDQINGNPANQLNTSTSGNAILGTFNPNDIESITFLKDAAASAIWGARAANGVIVITTKKGKKNTSDISFNTSLSTAEPGNFRNMTAMNSAQYIELEQELVDKNFIQDPVAALLSSPANGWRTGPVSEAMEWMFKAKRNPTTQNIAQRDSALNVLSNRSNRDQLRDYMLQRAVTQQYNLSFSGGANNSSYFISGNYTKDQPIFRSNSGETYSVNSNFTNEFLNKRLTVNTGLSYNAAKAQVNSAALRALSVGAYGMTPYELLVDQNGNRIYKGVTYTKYTSDSLTRVRNLMPWTYNAIDELNYNHTITSRNAFRVNSSITGKITNWLTATASGQMQRNLTDQVNNQNLNSYATRDLFNNSHNPANLNNQNFLRVNAVPKGGIYKSSRNINDDYGLRGQLDAKKTFAEDHRIEVLAGTEIRQAKYAGNEATLYGYDEQTSTSVAVNATANYSTLAGGSARLSVPTTVFKGRQRYLSYYSAGSYNYKQKYFATGSVRLDDINILGVDRGDRARPLWSTGLRWDVKAEDFMQNVGWINGLSLRATVGTAGNPPLVSNNYTTIGAPLVDSYTQLPYVSISNPANQGINWETTKTTNFGIDVSLFNSRLSFNLDVYKKKSYDILINLPINTTYGFGTLLYNAGDLESNGVDLGLNGQILKAGKFEWNSTLNLAYNNNKVTDARFPPVTTTVGLPILTSGYPVDNLFAYRWAGLNATGQSQIYNAAGDVLSSTGFPTIKAEDRVYGGRTTPPYFGGFMNTFRYGNLSLMARITYNLGHRFLIKNINSSNYPTGTGHSGLLATSVKLTERWRQPGDEVFTDVPGLTGNTLNSISWYRNSDINIRDAGHIRFQQLSLSYSVPKRFLDQTKFVKAANIGATISNLGLLWVANDEGIDPDYQMTEAFTNLPPTRNYFFNLSVTF